MQSLIHLQNCVGRQCHKRSALDRICCRKRSALDHICCRAGSTAVGQNDRRETAFSCP